jgi:hypothetical protein
MHSKPVLLFYQAEAPDRYPLSTTNSKHSGRLNQRSKFGKLKNLSGTGLTKPVFGSSYSAVFAT